MTGRLLLAALLAGWLADRLARPDRDVEAGIEAYEAGELDVALERFDAAIARHGDRPELSLNRGLALLAQGLRAAQASEPKQSDGVDLPDAARRAFERASESDDPEVRSSAFYERGNVAFDAEEWDIAIEAYIECLKARPDHANAKWNLELARKKKQEQEKEDEKEDEEEEKDDQQDETGGEDSGSSSDSGGSTGDDSGGSTGDDSGGSSGDDGSGGSTGGEDSGGGSGGSGEPPEQEPKDDQPQDDQPKDEQPPPDSKQPPPAPLDQMDLQKALEDLDEQDHFLLDRPSGGVRPPTEDW
jgi:Ca-activated chloride channel family protein